MFANGMGNSALMGVRWPEKPWSLPLCGTHPAHAATFATFERASNLVAGISKSPVMARNAEVQTAGGWRRTAPDHRAASLSPSAPRPHVRCVCAGIVHLTVHLTVQPSFRPLDFCGVHRPLIRTAGRGRTDGELQFFSSFTPRQQFATDRSMR